MIIRFTTLAGNSACGHDIKVVTAGIRGMRERVCRVRETEKRRKGEGERDTRALAAVTVEKNQFRESSTVRYKTGWGRRRFFPQLAGNGSGLKFSFVTVPRFSVNIVKLETRFCPVEGGRHEFVGVARLVP